MATVHWSISGYPHAHENNAERACGRAGDHVDIGKLDVRPSA